MSPLVSRKLRPKTRGQLLHNVTQVTSVRLNRLNSLVLAPADRALESCAKFSTRLTKSSSYTRLSDKYANEIATADLDALREMLRRHLNDANAAERRFEQRGKVRRFYQRTTRFLSTFGRYLDGYGGVVELMSTIGGQYGKAAYSTLSILLVVSGKVSFHRILC